MERAAAEHDVGVARPAIGIDMDLGAAERHRQSAPRQDRQRGNRPVEAAQLRRGLSLETQQAGAIGEIERRAVGREILRHLALQNGLRRFQPLIGLQGPVERGDRDGRLAAAKEAVGKVAQAGDHDCLPHRLSYCTKFGSAFSSLKRPIRLLRMPPR